MPDFEKMADLIAATANSPEPYRSDLRANIATALREVHRATLEQAAGVADKEAGDWRIDDREYWAQGFQDGAMEVAAAIRALAPAKEQTGK